MRRPQHMSMKELIALPILSDSETQFVPGYAIGNVYGCAFEDHFGRAWGTTLRNAEWVRYPLRRSVVPKFHRLGLSVRSLLLKPRRLLAGTAA